MKLKKGDEVVVIIGKDKGRKGKIERVNLKKNTVLIPGINVFKRHMKRRDEKHPGGIVEVTKLMNVSKVMLVCPKCKKPTRVGYLPGKDKIRICRKCKGKI